MGAQRRLHQKVKTGCRACKTGRVKCDERRPVCRRCERSGRECVFDPIPAWSFRTSTFVAAQQATLVSAYRERIPTWIITTHMDSQRARALQFFRERTSVSLGSFSKFTKSYFEVVLPLLSEEEEAVRSMAIAVATKQELLSDTAEDNSSLHLLQSTAYSQAVSHLTRPDVNVIAAIQGSLLLMSFECFNSPLDLDPGTGVRHLGAAIRILNEHRASMETATSQRRNSIPNLLYDYVEPMCLGLEVMLSFFRTPMYTIRNMETASNDAREPDLPSEFTDLLSARTSFSRIVRWSYHYRAQLADENEPWTLNCPAFKLIRRHFLAWHDRALELMSSFSKSKDAKHLKPVLVTMISQWSLLMVAFSYSTVPFDSTISTLPSTTSSKQLTLQPPYLPEGGRLKTSIVDLTSPKYMTTTFIVGARTLRLLEICDWTATGLEGDFDLQIWPTAEVRVLEDGSGRGIVRLRLR
jgi:hypothetical protein